MNGRFLQRWVDALRPDEVTESAIRIRGLLTELRETQDRGAGPFLAGQAADALCDLAARVAPARYGRTPIGEILRAGGAGADEQQAVADVLGAARARLEALETGRVAPAGPDARCAPAAAALERALGRLVAEHRRTAGAPWKRALLRAAALAVAAGVLWVAFLAGFYAWRNVQTQGLRVTYYRGEHFERPMACDTAFALFKDFGRRGPAWWMPRNHFSSRWEGWLLVPVSTNYAFYSQSDDGLRLLVDDRVVIDHWPNHVWEGSGHHGSAVLERGAHKIIVEHHEATGTAGLRIRWCGGPIPPDAVMSAPFLSKVRRDPPGNTTRP